MAREHTDSKAATAQEQRGDDAFPPSFTKKKKKKGARGFPSKAKAGKTAVPPPMFGKR